MGGAIINIRPNLKLNACQTLDFRIKIVRLTYAYADKYTIRTRLKASMIKIVSHHQR